MSVHFHAPPSSRESGAGYRVLREWRRYYVILTHTLDRFRRKGGAVAPPRNTATATGTAADGRDYGARYHKATVPASHSRSVLPSPEVFG